MQHVEACLSGREDPESCLHRCAGPVLLVEPVYRLERPDNAVLTSE